MANEYRVTQGVFYYPDASKNADNAAALAGWLVAGDVYRKGDNLKIRQ